MAWERHRRALMQPHKLRFRPTKALR